MNTTGGVLVVLHEQHEDVVREMRERMIQKREREREREREMGKFGNEKCIAYDMTHIVMWYLFI
jgi:hypothetical protein